MTVLVCAPTAAWCELPERGWDDGDAADGGIDSNRGAALEQAKRQAKAAGPGYLPDGFQVPAELSAREPAEARGLARDEVRLLVSRGGGERGPATVGDGSGSGNVNGNGTGTGTGNSDGTGTGTDTGPTVAHHVFSDLPDVLQPGDLLVVNNSGTLPAALDAVDETTGTELVLHVSTGLPEAPDAWIVELRRPRPGGATAPFALTEGSPDPESPARAGARLRVTGGATVTLVRPHSARLWVARLDLGVSVAAYLTRHGRPIRYSYVDRDWPLATYQTAFAAVPGSAEMPSAARPFTPDLIARLAAKGVLIAPITLHTGVASPEAHEKPYAEWYDVPASTADLVNHVRARGGRVIAVGTTAVRALESVTEADGTVRGTSGWTDLIITPERGVRAVDGLLTGFHEPEASHLLMLTAVAGEDLMRVTYAAAVAERYLWHEFGDVNLILSR